MLQFPGNVLLCPVCHEPLNAGHGSSDGTSTHDGRWLHLLICGQGHRFDAARQGYFNLLTGRGTGFEADTAEMVQARIDFLSSDHFSPLAEAVCEIAKQVAVDRPVVLDAGAGTGYYLGKLEQRVPLCAAVALDISKFALRRAAKLLPGALCLVWDVWRRLPVADEAVDLILNIFAPRNSVEFARVARDGAVLLVVTPLPRHLNEIADVAGLLDIRPHKDDDVAASLADAFELEATRVVDFAMNLTPRDVQNVAAMGPAGHHDRRVRTDVLPEHLAVTASFTVQSFRRRIRERSQRLASAGGMV